MGDAGAYSVGYIIARSLILLATRHENLAKWSLLATVFWPVMKLFTPFIDENCKSPQKPDLMHFHHVVMRGLR